MISNRKEEIKMPNFEKKLMENQNRHNFKKSWVVSSGDGTMFLVSYDENDETFIANEISPVPTYFGEKEIIKNILNT
jgi:hypothetical protein